MMDELARFQAEMAALEADTDEPKSETVAAAKEPTHTTTTNVAAPTATVGPAPRPGPPPAPVVTHEPSARPMHGRVVAGPTSRATIAREAELQSTGYLAEVASAAKHFNESHHGSHRHRNKEEKVKELAAGISMEEREMLLVAPCPVFATAQLPLVMLELEAAVQVAIDWVNAHSDFDDTLLVVGSDHETSGYTLLDGDLSSATFTTGGAHSATPVPLYAKGPGAERLEDVAHIADLFLLLTGQADRLPSESVCGASGP